MCEKAWMLSRPCGRGLSTPTRRVLFALIAPALLGTTGCVTARVERIIDRAELKAEIQSEMKADISANVVRIEKLEAQVGNLKSRQTGLVNIASTGGGILGYVLAIFVGIVLMKRSNYWRLQSVEMVEEIEKMSERQPDAGKDLKARMAKRHASETAIGALVKQTTKHSGDRNV